jgi:hypothetical protein
MPSQNAGIEISSDGQHDRDDKGEPRQHEGRRKCCLNAVDHRHRILDRVAEVALQCSEERVQVLHEERIVDTVVVANSGDLLSRQPHLGVLELDHDAVARQSVQQEE